MASKYTLKVDSREFPYREMEAIQEGCVAADYEHSREPEILKVFDSEEEAISALKKYHTEVSEFWASNIHYWYLSSDGNTVTVLALPGVKKQDYIRISRGSERCHQRRP